MWQATVGVPTWDGWGTAQRLWLLVRADIGVGAMRVASLRQLRRVSCVFHAYAQGKLLIPLFGWPFASEQVLWFACVLHIHIVDLLNSGLLRAIVGHLCIS